MRGFGLMGAAALLGEAASEGEITALSVVLAMLAMGAECVVAVFQSHWARLSALEVAKAEAKGRLGAAALATGLRAIAEDDDEDGES